MKKTFFLELAFILFSFTRINAQGGVAVNTAGSPPDSSALFDLSSTSKGTLLTRMTTAQRDAIVNPAKGLTIFNIDCSVYNYNAGTPEHPNWATMSASNVLTAGVSIAASPAGAICTGISVTFTATPSQNNLSPSYQWQVNGNNVGTNSTIFTSNSLNNGDVVSCILSSNVPCVTGSPAASNAITELVNTVPVITGTTPASYCSGSSVTLGASASSGAINWYSYSAGGSSLSSGASFTTSGLTQTTNYYVDATANGCTSPIRTAVTATYYPNAPVQPGAITGTTAEITDSTALYYINPLSNTASYVWTVTSGSIISGQGTDSVIVTWSNASGSANISVAASNACATSSAQSITIYFGSETFSYTGSVQSITFPAYISSVTIEALGAQGGSGYGSTGGYGAEMQGTFSISPGEVLTVGVGQQPGANGNSGGGGGSSGVKNGNVLLLVAGGGGGGGYDNTNYNISNAVTGTSGQNTYGCGGGTILGYGGTGGSGGEAGSNPCGDWPQGSGGAGVNGNGGSAYGNGNCSGGLSTGAGGAGSNGSGGGYGFAGGGGASYGGGGGGGYSGGAGGASAGSYISGGGGGSYNAGTNQTNSAAVQSGNGQVVITW